MNKPELKCRKSENSYTNIIRRPCTRLLINSTHNSLQACVSLRRSTANGVYLQHGVYRQNDVIVTPCMHAFQAEINAEFSEHKDLVQGNFIDSYKNLTLKAVLGLRWISRYCSEAPFAIKTDDDTFLNIFEMVRLMNENANKTHVRYFCTFSSLSSCQLSLAIPCG